MDPSRSRGTGDIGGDDEDDDKHGDDEDDDKDGDDEDDDKDGDDETRWDKRYYLKAANVTPQEDGEPDGPCENDNL